MTDSNDKVEFKPHPIQTTSINVRELYIKANQPPDIETGLESETFHIAIGQGLYNQENNRIVVAMKIETDSSPEAANQPYALKIEILGEFEVDTTRFPIEHIPDWAKRNAPFILMPYLREHAYSLTNRAGFRPLILPLMEVPTAKIPKA